MDDTVLIEDVLSSSGSSVEMIDGPDQDSESETQGRDDVIFVVRRSHIYLGILLFVTLCIGVMWYCYNNIVAIRDDSAWIIALQGRRGQYLLDYDAGKLYPIELVSQTPVGEDTLISSVYDVFHMVKSSLQPRLRRGIQATRHAAKSYYKLLFHQEF